MTTTTRTNRRIASPRKPDSSLKRILVATAGDPESRGALDVAAALAARDGAAVVAIGVATPFPHNVSTLLSMRQPASIDEDARHKVLESVRLQVQLVPGGEGWESYAFVGNSADVINDLASEWNASLIVLGLGRHRGIDRLFGSETAIAVLRQARVPVLAVPATAHAVPKRILAAMDFTPASVAAASLASALLPADGTLLLAHVRGFRGAKAQAGDLVDLYHAGEQAKLEEAVRAITRRTKCRVEAIALDGEPGEALVAAARREHCDAIALGGHHLGLLDRVLLGSVRTRVVRHAPCGVLIAPASGID